MLNILRYSSFILLLLSFSIFYGCKKESNLPVDGDNNVYDTVVIGTQVWLAENLKTTKYNNGVSIPLVTDNNQWTSISSAAYCWYENNPAVNKEPYGALYNGWALNVSFICPLGYHAPNDEEWNILINYLGGEEIAGDKLKATGTQFWGSGNYSTNESGFTAMPGGKRSQNDGTFWSKNSVGYWWSSTPEHYLIMNSSQSYAHIQGLGPRSGFSIRCIKD
jgi:uncharacterized protein (TIGR02145 family)